MTWMNTGYRKAARGLFAVLFCTLSAALFTGTMRGQADVVHVSAASDMEPVLEVAGPIFERQTGLKLKISYGSSAALSQQIQNGSPADIFFSADFYFAEQVVSANLTETRQPTLYARGLLVLWARNDSRFKPLSIDVLERKDIKSVAVANPDRAPYGRAALAVMRKTNVYNNLAPHLVQAETVAQAAQFALSGNAEVAIVSQTIAMSPKYRSQGSFVLFPISQYPEIRQCAVILKAGANREGAHRLLTFMLSDQVQQNLPKLGLQKAE